jgi:hypothetical protein
VPNETKGEKMKQQKFERVEGVKYLYRRSYQTSDDQWSVHFYGLFKTWQGDRWPWPFGTERKTAEEALALLLADNVKRVDLRTRRVKAEPPPERMTVAKYIPIFLIERGHALVQFLESLLRSH